jgi:hypothetical protein
MKHLLADVKPEQLLYLGLNAFCFFVYTSLAIFTFTKIRGVYVESRTKQIVAVFISIFLCNEIFPLNHLK